MKPTWLLRLVVIVVSILATLDTEHAHAQFDVCPGSLLPSPVSHVAMTRSQWGNDNNTSDIALWSSTDISVYDRGWRSYWELNTSNPAVWINWSAGFTDCRYSRGCGSTSCFQKHTDTNNNNFGTTRTCGIAVHEVDIEVSGSTFFNATPATHPVQHQGSCVWGPGSTAQGFAQEGTLVHELGHAYGYSHFNDWLSTMNTSQPDITSCQQASGATRMVRPSAQAQQCHDLRYGLPSAVDVGSTALREICPLTGGGCAAVFGAGRGAPSLISSSSTFVFGAVEYTAMNARDATPGTVGVKVWASRDNILNSGDGSVFVSSIPAMSAGETREQVHWFFFNPQVAMPVVGATYCLLVELDPSSVISEANELDNVLDTAVCYVRT